MKQIVIRILGPQLPVFDVVYGEIVDGQFTPLDIDSLDSYLTGFLHCDTLLGGQAYVEAANLLEFVTALVGRVDAFEFYPNFLVFKFKDHEVEEKTA